MELKRYFLVLLKWSWLIALAVAIAGVLSYRAAQQMPKTYQTTTVLLVGQFYRLGNPQAQDFTMAQQLAQAYALIANRQPILEPTIAALSLNTSWYSLSQRVYAVSPLQSPLLQITVADTNPQRAKAIADEIANQLIQQGPSSLEREASQRLQFATEQLGSLQSKIENAEQQASDLDDRLAAETSARRIQDLQARQMALRTQITTWQQIFASLLATLKEGRTNVLTVIQPAYIPDTPSGPNVQLNVLVAAAVAFLLSLSMVLLMEYLDDTIRRPEDLRRALSLPVLGSIARIRHTGKRAGGSILLGLPEDGVSEEFRLLRAKIGSMYSGNEPPVLMVTSPGFSQGRTSLAANLSVSFAQAGWRTVLVDADLRHPQLATLFGLPGDRGLTSLLRDGAQGDELNLRLKAFLLPTGTHGLELIAGGLAADGVSPSDLLASPTMDQLIARLRIFSDVVIIDSPPVLPVADATILGSKVSGVILVVRAGKTRASSVKSACYRLQDDNVRFLGAVLNAAQNLSLAHHRRYLSMLKRASRSSARSGATE